MEQAVIDQLIDAASKARENATPKRTGFRVGAALLAANGDVITGCNMELKTFLTGICAERCAMAKALSEGYREFTAIAVVTDGPSAASPCSICRQFLLDLGLDLQVIMSNEDKSDVCIMTMKELVPMAFLGASSL